MTVRVSEMKLQSQTSRKLKRNETELNETKNKERRDQCWIHSWKTKES